MQQVNFNTVLLSVVIALAGWNLKETVSQGNTIAKFEERIVTTQREVQDFRLRMAQAESDLVLLKIELAKMSRQ